MRIAGTNLRPTFDWRPILALLLLVLFVAGCRGLLVEPGPSVASLNLAIAPAPSVAVDGITDAFDQADNVLVRILRQGKPPIEEIFDFLPAEETRISIRIELDEDEEPATILVQLRRGAAVLFRAEQSVVLRAGDAPGIQLTLAAIPDRVVIDGVSALTFQSVGDTIQLYASVQFATGDELPRAPISWMTTAPSVAAVNSTGTVVIVGPGDAEIRASHGDLVDAVAVQVVQVVSSVVVQPSGVELEIGGTAQLTATARDARGHIVPGRSVAWSSSSPNVAVNSSGLVTAIEAGEALVTAEIGDARGTSFVQVLLPEPEPSPFAGNWWGYIEDPEYPDYYWEYVDDLMLEEQGSTLVGTIDMEWGWWGGVFAIEQVDVQGDAIFFSFLVFGEGSPVEYRFSLWLGQGGYTLNGTMEECYSFSDCYFYSVNLYQGDGPQADAVGAGADATAGGREVDDNTPRTPAARERRD